MDLKHGSKSAAAGSMKAPSGDASMNSIVDRIDQALDEEKNRREQLSRRPSYRKILKELGGSKAVSNNETLAASDEDGDDGLSGEEPSNVATNNGQPQHKLAGGPKQQMGAPQSAPQQSLGASVILVPHTLASASTTQSPALRNSRSPNDGAQNNSYEVHDATAAGASPSSSLGGAITSSHHFVGLIPAGLNMNMMQMEGASQQLGTLLANAGQPTAILQYAHQGLDGQLYIPAAAANMQAYQMAAAASANSAFGMGNTQQLLVATAPSGSTSSSNSPIGATHGGGDDSTRKREMRLLKNREAARECRRKKKEYVKCLENRVAVLESQNKTLIDELKALKELYCSKDVPAAGQSSAGSVPQS